MFLLLAMLAALNVQAATRPAPPDWQAAGTLLECCSCNVPCSCNFGQGPSPNDFCHTLYTYRFKTARYDGVALDGLIVGGGEGPKGAMGFLDSRARPEQRNALKKLALAVFGKGGATPGDRTFTWVALAAETGAKDIRVRFGESGGFAADILLGADGKNPIVVENNVTWPVHRFIKAKTTRFDYKDSLGNNLNYEGRNANVGEFRLSGSLRQATAAKPSAAPCCAGRRSADSRSGSR